ncbi:MAG TPA: NAD(P)H-dependent oxidoreductase subunit E, partial [Anaerolineales bacterium]|nr:NAD(P)H-dependent oxidoreductase subunit E [Anaerolineales bacterium]
GDIVAALEAEYEVKSGGTTADGRLSVTTARCLGSCGLAPMLVLDGAVLARNDANSTLERVAVVLDGTPAQEAD